ncbi:MULTISPECIES: DUF4336 domain-containing protein [Neorhizobium]|jgi:hypothetical protein|uniref:DUF4336 domain-containing protein n=1 Tax=Neorhizobium sp. T6_25 TaxID=2093833 RepID=UPI000CF914C7|nr:MULTISPECIES: DUF4336 domain-containing protein [Neorhizobium]
MTTYPPLNVLKPVGDRIWIVDSGPLHAGGVIPLPVRMTVMQLDDGGLLLHSPTHCDARLREELQKLGPVRHLIAPNSAHWSFVKDWQAHFPGALAWSAPGLRNRRQVKRAAIAWHDDLGVSSQSLWAPEIEQIEVPGIGGFREVCFFHSPSSSLILTDLVQNLDRDHTSVPMRLFSKLAGSQEKAPIYLRLVVKLKGKDARDAAGRLMSLQPKRVIFSHGAWFEDDADARLRKSLDWLI